MDPFVSDTLFIVAQTKNTFIHLLHLLLLLFCVFLLLGAADLSLMRRCANTTKVSGIIMFHFGSRKEFVVVVCLPLVQTCKWVNSNLPINVFPGDRTHLYRLFLHVIL